MGFFFFFRRVCVGCAFYAYLILITIGCFFFFSITFRIEFFLLLFVLWMVVRCARRRLSSTLNETIYLQCGCSHRIGIDQVSGLGCAANQKKKKEKKTATQSPHLKEEMYLAASFLSPPSSSPSSHAIASGGGESQGESVLCRKQKGGNTQSR